MKSEKSANSVRGGAFGFNYRDMMPFKPPIAITVVEPELITKQCRRCGATFTTRSRVKKRCDSCQADVGARMRAENNELKRARTTAARWGRLLL